MPEAACNYRQPPHQGQARLYHNPDTTQGAEPSSYYPNELTPAPPDDRLSEPTLADAILDRLLHRAGAAVSVYRDEPKPPATNAMFDLSPNSVW